MLTPYWIGFNRFCDGESLDACQNKAERRGWYAALFAAGEAL